jgi:2-polyprenyl-3-methyl-5-hydroxy-6-metoxy-1,4-benzoquinol methylase
MADPRLSAPPAAYYSQFRRDVAALVPTSAVRVLDVGCGFGALGRLLAVERGCEVHGVERNPDARLYLEGVYKTHIIGDVESSAGAFSPGYFDCIVFADILEHLVDPLSTLRGYRELLAPHGVVVASIPNVRNLSVVYNLLVRGRWQYKDSGLLDRTHLRFFTRAEIHELFENADLHIERVEVNRDSYGPFRKVLMAVLALAAPDLSVCQFRIAARLPQPYPTTDTDVGGA